MAFFAKFRRKLRTKNFEAHFNRKLRTLEKCSNVKKLRTAEPQPIFTGSYKKKKCNDSKLMRTLILKCTFKQYKILEIWRCTVKGG